MGLYKTTPPLSGRMGALWCLSGIMDSAVVEFGCMGHMAYGRTFLHRMSSLGSKLYSTHISETDIAMGNTSRLTATIEQITEKDGIHTIFLLPSSVPEMIGIDLNAITYELASRFPAVRLIPLSAGGFTISGHKGVEQTLLQLVREFPRQTKRTEVPTFNIIGSSPDLFRCQPDRDEIIRLMSGAFSMRPLCSLASGSMVSQLETMGGAHINLVIRREGEPAAKLLQERFGIPYVLDRPYGITDTIAWLEETAAICGIQPAKEFIQLEQKKTQEEILPMRIVLSRFLRAHKEEARLTLAGHRDVVSGIAGFAKEELGFEKTECYCDCPEMAGQNMIYLDDDRKKQIAQEPKGFLMGSGELLHMAHKDLTLQIAAHDNQWHHAYEPPLVGFRGAVTLTTMLVNEMMQKD